MKTFIASIVLLLSAMLHGVHEEVDFARFIEMINKSSNPVIVDQDWLSKRGEVEVGPYNCTRVVEFDKPTIPAQNRSIIDPGQRALIR